MGKSKKGLKIGILTAGGDCPGINAAIRGVAKTAMFEYGMKVIGISSGFRGLIENEYSELTEKRLSGILTLGGTVLGTSREKPFKTKNEYKDSVSNSAIIKKNYKNLELDALVCIGGNGTMNTAFKLSEEGMNIIGIPKTIDNDVWGTDQTFGFDSAVGIATDAIDRLHTTANSHKRIMLIELMGHHAGWLTLFAGIAGGGDIILIPELSFSPEILVKSIKKRYSKKKPYSIVVVAEGIKTPEKQSPARYISKLIQEETGLETRDTILGYIQRGGTPSAMDRILATRFGSHAVSLIVEKKFGNMVSLQNNRMTYIALSEVANKKKLVPPDHSLIMKGKSLGTCFGI